MSLWELHPAEDMPGPGHAEPLISALTLLEPDWPILLEINGPPVQAPGGSYRCPVCSAIVDASASYEWDWAAGPYLDYWTAACPVCWWEWSG